MQSVPVDRLELDHLMPGRTTFVVAHRWSTLRSASHIIVLEDGAMVGLDRHAELLADCVLDLEMWALHSMHAPEPGASNNHLAKELATC